MEHFARRWLYTWRIPADPIAIFHRRKKGLRAGYATTEASVLHQSSCTIAAILISINSPV